MKIQNDAEYSVALAEVTALINLDPPTGSPEGARLTVLADAIEAYEQVTYPMDEPSDGMIYQAVSERTATPEMKAELAADMEAIREAIQTNAEL